MTPRFVINLYHFEKEVKRKKNGVTLVEILLAVLFLSLLFTVAYRLMSYSRQEVSKGFWIQKTITQLRNSTQLIAQKLKETSYPSAIVKGPNGSERVISFKERRTYDVGGTGRLTNLEINTNKDFDLHAMVTDGGQIVPTITEQRVMYFPICKPESPSKAGEITWVELILAPSHDYKITGAGNLFLRERKTTYSTTNIFGLTKPKLSSLPITKNKLLVSDVANISIEKYGIDELRGVVYRAGKADPDRIYRKRILTTFSISCRHPKDHKIWLSDQCSIINNVGFVKLATQSLLQLIKVISSGPSGSAILKINGAQQTYHVGNSLGGYKISKILPNAVVIKLKGSNIERYITKDND